MAFMDQDTSESDKMLHICIYHYFLKRKLNDIAEAFKKAVNVPIEKTEIDDPADFFYGWWTVFWDLNNAERNAKHSEAAAFYTKAQRTKRRGQYQMQQSLLRNNNHSAFRGSINGMNSQGKMRQHPEHAAAKMNEERMKKSNLIYSDASQTLVGANRMIFPNSETSHQGFNQNVNGNPENISTMQPIENLGLASDLADPTNYHYLDPSLFSDLGGGSLSAKNGQSSKNAVSIGTQVQPGSTQDNRKRKEHSTSIAANATVAQTKNTPGNGVMPSTSFQHCNNVQNCTRIACGIEGTEGPASNSISLPENMEPLGDGFFDDVLRSFLSSDIEDCGNLDDTIKQSHPAEQQKQNPEDFVVSQFACTRTSSSEVTCCHFSSDGKFLASAGNDKKVFLWSMDTLQTESMAEEHKSTILDVRFRPNSSHLATASMDKSVRIWDAANPSHSMYHYTGHNSAVMSVDFHPNKTDLLCFSDSENEIWYWNMTASSFTGVLKGGNAQVRFQPGAGELLAAAYDKGVSIFNVETGRQIYSLQGHPEEVNYICWGANGDVLASVSSNLVKFWSLSSGKCTKGLSSNKEQYHSCVFHPSYSNLLLIGGTSCLELWDIAEDKSMTIPAYQNIVSCLVQSPVTKIVASASHDCTVKLWK